MRCFKSDLLFLACAALLKQATEALNEDQLCGHVLQIF